MLLIRQSEERLKWLDQTGVPVGATHCCTGQEAVAHKGPVHPGEISLQIGKAIRLRGGSDVTLISTGGMSWTAGEAAEQPATPGIQTRVLLMHTLKPLDNDAVPAAARETGAVLTLGEHSIVGGVGIAVAEPFAEQIDLKVLFKRLGVPNAFPPHIGAQDYMLAKHGLSPGAVAQSVADFLKRARRN